MITHLMMDVDGVVITGRPRDGLPWKTDLEADLGLSVQSLVDAFFAPYWSEIVTGQRELYSTLVHVLANIAPDLSADQLINYWFSNDARLDHAVLSDLSHLRARGLKICFATNQDALRTRYIWDELRLREYADQMLSSSQLHAAKPSLAFFRRTAARTNAAPAAHLLIDDSGENVKAARAAGWKAHQWVGPKACPRLSKVFRPVED